LNYLRKYLILAAALLMSLCLGSTYSWSAFVEPLKSWTGLDQGRIQFPFNLFYIVFPATLVVAGTLYARLGPRRCAVAGGVLFGGGWMLAGLGAHHFLFTLLGIGLFGGIGVGLAYIVPITTAILWFPNNKGLVTGVAVAGFGGGAALVSQIADAMLRAHRATPFALFGCFGLAFMILIVLGGSLMAVPPGTRVDRPRGLRLDSALGERTFWLLYLAMFAGLAAGFAVNPNLKQLSQGHVAQTGLSVVALFALANALGRIVWGLIFDRMRAATAIRLNLVLQALVLLASGWLLKSAPGLNLFALLVGFNYGGVLVLYASTAARRWGAQRLGPTYGWLFSANIPASFASSLAGGSFERWHSFVPALMAIGLLLGAIAPALRIEEGP